MSDLALPTQVFTGGNAGGNLYIADTANNRIQMVSATSQTMWGQTMTANDVYTVAGSAAGTLGSTGDGQNAHTTALLFEPQDVCISTAGDMYIADTLNERVQEVPKAAGTEWGVSQTASDMYTIVGSTAGNAGSSPNGTAAASALLSNPTGIACLGSTQLYVTDGGDNEIQEVPSAAVTAWGVTMAADKIYTIAGSVARTQGFAGDGGAAASALLDGPVGTVAFDSSGNLDLADTENDEVRQVSKTSFAISDYAGGAGFFDQEGDGGIAVNAALNTPGGIASDPAGDVFAADAAGNRVQEIAASSHTQFGIAMTAGDVYTVAGSAGGYLGDSGDGGKATSALLNAPVSLAFDGAGNLYIDDDGNCRIQEVSASTANISTVAGSATGTCGNSGNGGHATSALLSDPLAVAADAAGDIFIAGGLTNQVQEVPASTGNGMTEGDIYTIAGSTDGSEGSTGDGGPVASSLLSDPAGVTVDAAGNVYIADASNYRIQEIAGSAHTQFGHAMTKGDIYTIAGQTGDFGNSGDGGPATSADLDITGQLALDSSGDLYITDQVNNQIREVAAANGTQWGQLMTAGDIYTVAGSKAGTPGASGDGGPATSALLDQRPASASTRPVTSSSPMPATRPCERSRRPRRLCSLRVRCSRTRRRGVTVSQADGSLVTFYPKSGSSCASPYTQAAGGYCTLPLDAGASLTFSSGSGTYAFVPSPGDDTYAYSQHGQFVSETDPAGDAATMTYQSPAPGSGACPATAASCETITSASGRALVVGSSGSGLITSVTDPMGRAWNYGYSGGDLTSATDPMSKVTSYTYGQGSTGNPLLASDLLTMTAPDAQPGGPDAGDSTVNVYNAAGQVTSQTDPMGFKTTFNYCVDVTTGNCLDAATGTGYVTVTDPDGNTTVYGYTQGAQISEAAWTAGTTMASEEDYVPAQTASGPSAGTQLDNVTSDGLGSIMTSTFDAAGTATSSTEPDGIGSQAGTTTDSYTSLNQISCDGTDQAAGNGCASANPPAPVTPGGVITPPSSAPPLGETWTLFDKDGNELYSTTGVYEPGGGTAAYSTTTYQIFKGDSVTLNGNTVTCTAVPPSASLPCAMIEPGGVVTQFGYNFQGDLTSSSAPDGNGTELATTTYTYNVDGQQTTEMSPDGNLTGANAGNYTTTTVYNSDGLPMTVTAGGATGHTVTPRVTTYGYDADGNQTTVTDARGFTTTTTPNADDKPALVKDPDGNATLTCYDGDGDVVQTVPPVGVASQNLTAASCPTAYPAGYVPSTHLLASDATMVTFDGQGLQTATYTPAPAGQSGFETTTYAYDGDGDLLTTTAPPATNGGQNQVTTQTYDAAGNLASTTTGSGSSAASTTSFCYDPNGDLTAVVAADGNSSGTASCETSSPWVVSSGSFPTQAAYQTTYSYDSDGQVVSSTSPATSAAPSGATTTETYNSSGDTLTRTDPNSVTTTWTYNPSDQPTTVSYSGSSAHSVSYSYDADGSQTGMTDATGSSTFTYDPFGELTSTQNGAGRTTGYGFNADGQVTGITYPLPAGATWATSSTVNYGYDNADLLNSVTDFNNHQISVGNNADGLTNSLGLGSSGDTITTTYDPTDTPSLISLKNSTSTLQSFSYSDAPAGTVLSETDTPSSPSSPATYIYDAKGRVTSMKPGTGTTLSYGFDPSGNLTTLPAGATGSYDHDSELTSSALAGTTTSYSYNADGERLGATRGGTATISAAWNGAGLLTSYDNAAANMTAASYDGNGDRATASGSGTQAFTWNQVSAIPQLILDANNAYIYAGGTAPAEQVSLSTGAITYLTADTLGSVRGTVSTSGALTGTASYDAWGNPATSGGLTASTPFGYAGGYTDPDGLIYLLNRYYDPAAGAFISVDPAISQTYEPYLYAGDNPVSRTDPTGLFWITYETIRTVSQLSQDNYTNFSAKMAGEIDKVTKKVIEQHIEKIRKVLALISAALSLIIPNHPLVGRIMVFVAAALGLVAAKHVVKLVRWVKKWINKGRGKFRGVYITDFSSLLTPNSYAGTTIRSCPSSRISCGSPHDGRHQHEIWP